MIIKEKIKKFPNKFLSLSEFDQKVLKIRNLIKKSTNPIIFFDIDADGCTSYFQLKKKFPKIEGYFMKKENQLECAELIKKKHDLIIIFDIPFLCEEFFINIKNKKIIWVDHHLTNSKELIKKYNIIHLNPLEFDKNDERPSCFFAYKIANSKENLPLACLGSVSDFFILDILIDLYKFDKKSFNILFKITDKKREELFKFIKKYKFNNEKVRKERENWIRYLTYECEFIDFKNLFDLMFKLEDKNKENLILKAIKMLEKMSLFEIKSNLNSEKGFLFEDYAKMKKKYKIIFKKALKCIDKKLIIFEYSGKISFTRQIAEELTYRFKKYKVIFVLFKKTEKEFHSGSFRGNQFNVNDLILNSLKNLNGNGGGHKYAAGLRIHKEDYEKFKEKIEKNVK